MKNIFPVMCAAAVIFMFSCAPSAVKQSVSRDTAGHKACITDIVFTRDSSRLFTSSNDGTLRVWDVKGNCITVISGYYDNRSILDVSPDGQLAATSEEYRYADRNAAAYLWHIQKGLLKRIPKVLNAKFINDRELLAAHSTSVELYSCENGELIQTMDVPDCERIFLGHKGAFAAASQNGTLLLFDRIGAKPKKIVSGKGKFDKLIFSDDDSFIVCYFTNEKPDSSGNWTYRIKAWQSDGTLIADFWNKNLEHSFDDIIIRGKCERFYLTKDRGGILVFDRKGKVLSSYQTGDEDTFHTLVTDDEHFLTAIQRNTLYFFPVNGSPVKRNKINMYSLGMSPDGRFVAAGSHDGTLQMYNTGGDLIFKTDDVSKPVISDFEIKPGELSGKSRGIVIVPPGAAWIDRDTFRISVIGRPNLEFTHLVQRRKSARDAAFIDGTAKMNDYFCTIRFSTFSGHIDYASMGAMYKKEFMILKPSCRIISEKYNEYGACTAVFEIQYKNLRDMIEWKGAYAPH